MKKNRPGTDRRAKKKADKAGDEILPTSYRKKPVVIEAIRWLGTNLREVIDFTGLHPSANKWTWEEYKAVVAKDGFKIFTLEGTHMVSVGDYVIRGVKGEFYACKPDIFALTYERATAPSSTHAPLTAETQDFSIFAEANALTEEAVSSAVASGPISRNHENGQAVPHAPQLTPFSSAPHDAMVNKVVDVVRLIGIKSKVPPAVYGAMCHEIRTIIGEFPIAVSATAPRIPVAWVARKDDGAILHFSAAQGWKVEVVLEAPRSTLAAPGCDVCGAAAGQCMTTTICSQTRADRKDATAACSTAPANAEAMDAALRLFNASETALPAQQDQVGGRETCGDQSRA